MNFYVRCPICGEEMEITPYADNRYKFEAKCSEDEKTYAFKLEEVS